MMKNRKGLPLEGISNRKRLVQKLIEKGAASTFLFQKCGLPLEILYKKVSALGEANFRFLAVCGKRRKRIVLQSKVNRTATDSQSQRERKEPCGHSHGLRERNIRKRNRNFRDIKTRVYLSGNFDYRTLMTCVYSSGLDEVPDQILLFYEQTIIDINYLRCHRLSTRFSHESRKYFV